jgi:hypothetical protein
MIAFLRKAAILVARVVTVGRYEPRAPKDGKPVDFKVPSVQEVERK